MSNISEAENIYDSLDLSKTPYQEDNPSQFCKVYGLARAGKEYQPPALVNKTFNKEIK